MKDVFTTYSIFLYIAVVNSSCQPETPDLPEGKWVNSNLDQVEFGEDSIELGYGFVIPPHKFAFQIVSDSFIIKYANVFGDPHRNFELVFDFEIQDTDTLVFYSHHLDGFFGRTYRLNKFVRTDKLFIAREWDSLVVPKVYTGHLWTHRIIDRKTFIKLLRLGRSGDHVN